MRISSLSVIQSGSSSHSSSRIVIWSKQMSSESNSTPHRRPNVSDQRLQCTDYWPFHWNRGHESKTSDHWLRHEIQRGCILMILNINLQPGSPRYTSSWPRALNNVENHVPKQNPSTSAAIGCRPKLHRRSIAEAGPAVPHNFH